MHQIEYDLEKALEKNEFEVYCQPIFSMRNLKISGFETLLRWHHPSGMKYPKEFISLAEESGLMQELGNFVIFQSCEMNQKLQKDFDIFLPVSVNLSTIQLRNQDIFSTLSEILNYTGLGAEFLHFEVKESVLSLDAEYWKNILREFKNAGIRISIDDCGAGNSMFRHLGELSFEKIKIDQSLVSSIGKNKNAELSIHNILELSRRLNKITVAEGVEMDSQFDFLKQNGCDEYQGFLLSHPLSFEEFKNFVIERS